jgi:mRNA interferase MazF
VEVVTAFRRYDVFLVGLDPTHGSEMRKTRPCVVVSPDEMNRHLDTVIVAPLTTTTRSYPTRVTLRFKGKTGQAALDHLRAIDKTRLVRRLGAISPASARGIADRLVEMFRFA